MVRAHHHHHAQRHQQREDVVLRPIELAVRKIGTTVEQSDRGGKIDHQLQEISHQVTDEEIVEGVYRLALHRVDRYEGRRDQRELGRIVSERAGNAACKGARKHGHQGHHGDEDLGRGGVEVGDDKVHLLTSPLSISEAFGGPTLRACSRQHAAGVR